MKENIENNNVDNNRSKQRKHLPLGVSYSPKTSKGNGRKSFSFSFSFLFSSLFFFFSLSFFFIGLTITNFSLIYLIFTLKVDLSSIKKRRIVDEATMRRLERLEKKLAEQSHSHPLQQSALSLYLSSFYSFSHLSSHYGNDIQ